MDKNDLVKSQDEIMNYESKIKELQTEIQRKNFKIRHLEDLLYGRGRVSSKQVHSKQT